MDSVFMSPLHSRGHAPAAPGPKLPPRDYLLHSTSSGSSLSDSFHSTTGGYAYARSRNSASAGDVLEFDSPSSSPPQVPLPSSGSSSVSVNEQSQQKQFSDRVPPQVKPKPEVNRARKPSPSVPKRSPLTQSTISESRDEVPGLPPRE